MCRHVEVLDTAVAVTPKCHLLGNTCSGFDGICHNTCTLKQKRTFLSAVACAGVYTNTKMKSVQALGHL